MEKSARRVSEGVMIERSVPTRIATARVGVGRSAARVSLPRFIGSNSAASPPAGALLASKSCLKPPSIGARHPR